MFQRFPILKGLLSSFLPRPAVFVGAGTLPFLRVNPFSPLSDVREKYRARRLVDSGALGIGDPSSSFFFLPSDQLFNLAPVLPFSFFYDEMKEVALFADKVIEGVRILGAYAFPFVLFFSHSPRGGSVRPAPFPYKETFFPFSHMRTNEGPPCRRRLLGPRPDRVFPFFLFLFPSQCVGRQRISLPFFFSLPDT